MVRVRCVCARLDCRQVHKGVVMKRKSNKTNFPSRVTPSPPLFSVHLFSRARLIITFLLFLLLVSHNRDKEKTGKMSLDLKRQTKILPRALFHSRAASSRFVIISLPSNRHHVLSPLSVLTCNFPLTCSLKTASPSAGSRAQTTPSLPTAASPRNTPIFPSRNTLLVCLSSHTGMNVVLRDRNNPSRRSAKKKIAVFSLHSRNRYAGSANRKMEEICKENPPV